MGFHEDQKNQMVAPLLALLKLFLKPANRFLSRKSRTKEEMLDHPSHNWPLDSPRRILNKINNKKVVVPLRLKRRSKKEKEEKKDDDDDGGFGDGGLWQKAILMGGKCQPPEFSGAIYYDYDGKQLSEPPRSPRASPLPNFYSSQPKNRI